MGAWSYAPQYRFYLKKGDGTTYSLDTLQTAQYSLVTGQGVNNAQISFADTTGDIKRHVQPRPMNLLRLMTMNRWGEWGIAYTGFIDTARRTFDPTQGDSVQLQSTGPVKLLEITRQTSSDAGALALAYAQNISGSAVLTYAARASGYPTSMLRIHPLADAGSGFQQINGAVFTQPDQQPWSSVVSAIQANSGVEWFFDEAGYCFWRQVGFLDPWFGTGDPRRPQLAPNVAGPLAPMKPRGISADDIIQADFAESDQGVVTRVEVRYWGGGGYQQTAKTWPDPSTPQAPMNQAVASMEAHLRTRILVVYAPWITTDVAAQYLAGVLGAQYAAGVATANVTIPADPLIGIGSLVSVPALGVDGSTIYYVSSITGQLAWGGQWVMTLGLSYGRTPRQQFPYISGVSYPVLTDAVMQGVNESNTVLALDASNPNWVLTAYTITANSTLTTNQAATAAFVPGATIQLYKKARSGGGLLGPSHEYTVVAPLAGQATRTIALKSTSSATGYVTIIDSGSDGSNNPVTDGTQTTNTGADATTGTGDYPGGGNTSPAGVNGPNSAQLKALNAALNYAGRPYILSRAGDRGFDCSGLVSAAYRDVGVPALFTANAYGAGENGDVGPQGIYAYFKRLGATDIDVGAAQPGDILFINDGGSFQNGFVHVAFAYGNGQNFGANNPDMGICVSPIAGYHSADGTPFNRALSMATVNWGLR